jgi:hypothetical protein
VKEPTDNRRPLPALAHQAEDGEHDVQARATGRDDDEPRAEDAFQAESRERGGAR